MIPNPRRINPRVSAGAPRAGPRRVLWLMGQAGYIGRDVAGLGAEPPPEAVSRGRGACPPPRRTPRRRPAAPARREAARRGPVPGMYHLGMKLARACWSSDYMTPNPIVARARGPAHARARDHPPARACGGCPVTVGGMLVGLVTEGDLKRAEPSTLTDSEEDFNRVMEETPISRIMIQNPITTTADTPLLEAAEILLNTKYGALPVVAGGRVVGHPDRQRPRPRPRRRPPGGEGRAGLSRRVRPARGRRRRDLVRRLRPPLRGRRSGASSSSCQAEADARAAAALAGSERARRGRRPRAGDGPARRGRTTP